MPSRKRNKGKERRAKKEASKGAWWRGWAVGDSESIAGCNHGCVALPSRDHAVSQFMNTFDDGWDSKSLHAALEGAFDARPEVWRDAEHRQMAIDIFLSMGTNMILHRSRDDDSPKRERGISHAILFLECYDGDGDVNYALTAMKAHRSLPDGCGERDVLKFYSKRLSCSCLKEKYKHARKTIPKLGKCMNCKERKERSYLTTCGRCKVQMYCSRECQVADWPDHEKMCDTWVGIRKCQNAKAAEKKP